MQPLLPYQFAFRKDHRCEGLLLCLRSIVENHNEYQTPTFLLGGDVEKAYDFTKHKTVIEGLRRKGVPKMLVAAYVFTRSQTKIFNFLSWTRPPDPTP